MTSNETPADPIDSPQPQRVRWGPVDRLPAGLLVEDGETQTFISWSDLKRELEDMLLPQVRIFQIGVTTGVFDLDDRKDWLVRVVDNTKEWLGAIWFGPNPDAAWEWDGLVRIGEPRQHSTRGKNVWQVFQ